MHIKNAYKLISLWGQYSQTVANAGGSAVAPTPDHLINNPFPPSNISDLSPKTV